MFCDVVSDRINAGCRVYAETIVPQVPFHNELLKTNYGPTIVMNKFFGNGRDRGPPCLIADTGNVGSCSDPTPQRLRTRM